jgi:hypothetical protein
MISIRAHAADPRRAARDYHRLIAVADLPGLAIPTTTDSADAATGAADFDLALGEPSLLGQVVPAMTALRWRAATFRTVRYIYAKNAVECRLKTERDANRGFPGDDVALAQRG